MRKHKMVDLPAELMAGVATPAPTVYKEPRKSTNRRRERSVRAEPEASKALTVIKDRKHVADWRKYLRPRYLKYSDGRIRVLPKQLSHEYVATLSASGGPFFGNAFTLPLSRDHLQDAEYWPQGKKRGYCIDAATQWDMFKLFLKTVPEPGIYIISVELLTPQLKQIVFTMMMHAVYACDCKKVKWAGLYSTHRDTLRDDKPVLDALVISNCHEGMDQTKFTKLRDMLHVYSNIPVFLIVDGVDGLEFAMAYLRQIPKMILKVGDYRPPTYIRTV
jgi:hypothetical protein